MALHDTDRNRTGSHGYLPWIIGAAAVAFALFFFMGDNFRARTTAPPSTTSAPQTTTPPPVTK